MNHPSTYRKCCRTAERAAKECAVLDALQASPLRHLVPRLTEVRQDPLVVEMSYIQGKAPTPDELGRETLDQLGSALRMLHRLRPCTTFGSFDAALDVPQNYATFDKFLEMQIGKWLEWHAPEPDSYLSSYVAWLERERNALRNYFRGVTPLFCHGDVDLKNMILQEGELTGLLDWEHAGSYCLAWELRKLPRVIRHDWQWHQLFSSYGNIAKTDQRTLIAAIHYLNAADLLGHLRWCQIRNYQLEKQKTLRQMHTLLKPREVK